MQWLAELSVRRPVFTWVLTLSLVVVGGASFLGLGVDRFPKIDFPMIVVTTVLPGASPEQVETEVTEPIEESLNSIAGLDELTSSSYEGFGVVMARFTLETDLGDASENVRDRINRILSQLPEGIEQPRVERLDPDAAPIMLVAVRTTRSVREATDFADRVLRRRLESLPGVGGVNIQGGQEREIQVVVDPTRLAALSLTARDLERALASQNIEIPGGNVAEGARTLQLRVEGRVRDPAAFAAIPIATRDGRVVHVSDVAEVLDTAEEPESLASIDGANVVILSIRKQSGSNTVAVIDSLRDRIAEIRSDVPPSYRLEIVRDESEFIRNSIHAVQEHLVLGGFLAALVVLLFLRNGRSTVIAALAIPSSIIATFALLAALKLTLNTITLLGLTLAVGIVIDDAIVVLENIVRYIEEKGYSPKRAAVIATQEIGLAVLATSLSLVAVFLPIAFMGGIIGRFMSSFGYTMSFSILVSLLVSFTLTPMLSSRWLKGPIRSSDDQKKPEPKTTSNEDLDHPDPRPEPRSEEIQTYQAWQSGARSVANVPGYEGTSHSDGGAIYLRIEAAYLRLLAAAMRRRWVVAIVLILSIVSIPISGRFVAKNFLPAEDESRFEVTIRAAEGTSLAETQLLGMRLARALRAQREVNTTVLTTGAPSGDQSGRGPNQASLYVRLVPAAQRNRTQDEFVAYVRSTVLPPCTPPNTQIIVSPIAAFGASGQAAAPIQYILSGPDIAQLDTYTQAILTRLRATPGVGDASTSLVTGRPAYKVHIDRARAGDLGVSVADVAGALRLSVGGVEVTTFADQGEQYDVRVRAGIDERSSPAQIAQITIPTSTPGRNVRLMDVATIEESSGPASIQHYARQRQSTLFVNTLPGSSEQSIIDALTRIGGGVVTLPAYHGGLTGRSREMGRAARSFGFAVLLSFIFMYLVLAAQFESWIHPVTILSSLPLTVPFALISALIMRQSLNLYSMLGILVLFGVVKKNSILQVDHVRALRRKGLSRADAVMVGNRDRLRPILMTTMAFVAGMLPLLVSSGAGSGTNRSIGSVVAGGQTLSLLLTLIATPVIFSWLDDLRFSRVVTKIRELVRIPLTAIDRAMTRKEKHTV